MAIITRRFTIAGPSDNSLADHIPTAIVAERFKQPIVDITLDDINNNDLDSFMKERGYLPFDGSQTINVFSRPGNSGAVIGRALIYCKTELGVSQLFARASDGLITQLTPPIRNNINGLVVNWTSVSTVTIGIGVCRDKTDSFTIRTIVPIIANMAIVGVGGLDTGVEAPSTFYSVFVIADSTGVLPPNSLLSTGGDNPTVLPPGYDIYRRVGYVRNNPASDFREFVSYGQGPERSIQYRDALSSRQQLVGGPAVVVTAVNCGSLIPNSSAYGRFQLAQRGVVVASFYDDPAQLLANAQRSLLASSTSCDVLMRVSANQRIGYANAAAGGLVDIWVLGYEEQL